MLVWLMIRKDASSPTKQLIFKLVLPPVGNTALAMDRGLASERFES